jgi:hypothetical protein
LAKHLAQSVFLRPGTQVRLLALQQFRPGASPEKACQATNKRAACGSNRPGGGHCRAAPDSTASGCQRLCRGLRHSGNVSDVLAKSLCQPPAYRDWRFWRRWILASARDLPRRRYSARPLAGNLSRIAGKLLI